MICALILTGLINFSDKYEIPELWEKFKREHIVDDDPYDSRRSGPWGQRPENPDDWNEK